MPLYAKGPGSELLDGYHVGVDPVQGGYMDNTNIRTVMATELEAVITPTDTPGPSSTPGPTSTPGSSPTFTFTPTPGVTPSDFIYLPLTEK